MHDLYLEIARKIPSKIRKNILEERLIEKAVNAEILNTPMEYLFDIYEHFIDIAGEYEDWHCPLCRGHVLEQWRNIKPRLEILENENVEHINTSK